MCSLQQLKRKSLEFYNFRSALLCSSVSYRFFALILPYQLKVAHGAIAHCRYLCGESFAVRGSRYGFIWNRTLDALNNYY